MAQVTIVMLKSSLSFIFEERFLLLAFKSPKGLVLLRISPRMSEAKCWTFEGKSMCKNSAVTLVGKHKTKKKIILCTADCDRWRCEECADKMLRLHQLRIIEGCGHTLKGMWTFLTLTANRHTRGFEASLENLKQGWTKLTERLRRKNGTKHYILIHEKHEDGSLHIHMLYNAWITKKWLKNNCSACGMGFIADVQKLRDPKSAGKYVTKYLTKAIGQGEEFPKRFKRVRYSNGFPKFEFESKDTEYNWTAHQRFTEDDESTLYANASVMREEIIDYRRIS